MSDLKPWRQVAIPHDDVLHGRFQQDEYAADLTIVHTGKAQAAYQDPAEFFGRTFITEGMRLLLDTVVRCLAGNGGNPVIQLQTAFGGGKTHTLLAIYHLATSKQPASALPGISPILDAAGVHSLPHARVAVLDGNQVAPDEPRATGGLKLRTLWGHLAYQLGGAEGYARVANSDASGTSPGKEVLAGLLESAQPCVILIDELVAYLRQFEDGKSLSGGTFDSILSFIQALTEAVKVVPRAIVLASLPDSEAEVGGVSGKKALDSLEKYFGRVQAIWKPVSSEESFEIVRRRLFQPLKDDNARDAACKAFHDTYLQHSDRLPVEVMDSHYLDRLRACYPLHPEIFDRLYEDWSTLEKFQRTRGVLRLLAKVLHQLWKANNNEAIILPSALPLDAPEVKTELILPLPTGFEPVIDRDIAGPQATATRIDADDSRFGAVQAARKAAACIFLGGAPSASPLDAPIGSAAAGEGATGGRAMRPNKGIDGKHIVLGCLAPGETPATYEDVLGRLRDRLHHLNEANGHYWLDTRPNLRREMEARKGRFSMPNEVLSRIKKQLESLLGKGGWPVHIFTSHADIPDDRQLRLVVLDPERPWLRGADSPAAQDALAILKSRGTTPRANQNTLLFLAADQGAMGRLSDQVRGALAWESIVTDADARRINLDGASFDQAKNEQQRAEKALPTAVKDVFKYLLVPIQDDPKVAPLLEAQTVSASTSAGLRDSLLRVVRENEAVYTDWAPVHLNNVLNSCFWKPDTPHVAARKVFEDFCRYLYLPRLESEAVFEATVKQGAADGLWGTCNGYDGGQYAGLKVKDGGAYYDSALLLVVPTVAEAQLQAEAAAAEAKRRIEAAKVVEQGGMPPSPERVGGGNVAPPPSIPGKVIPPPPLAKAPTRFVGTKVFAGAVSRSDFGSLIEEIYDLLGLAGATNREFRIEIEGEVPDGFAEDKKRALTQNAQTLGVEPEFF